MAETYIKDLISAGSADIAGKVLIVEVGKNFTFPRVDAGKHAFQIDKDDKGYAIKPLVYSKEAGKYVEGESPVVFSDENTVFFIAKRALAPYLDKQAQAIELSKDATPEVQLLAAFDAYAKEEFSMGVYNVLLADQVEIQDSIDGATTTTTTSTAVPTTTTTTTTAVQG